MNTYGCTTIPLIQKSTSHIEDKPRTGGEWMSCAGIERRRRRRVRNGGRMERGIMEDKMTLGLIEIEGTIAAM